MEKLRREMTVVHTWAGVVCSGLLFAMFWMGTLSVFDREIDQWMIPELRIAHQPLRDIDSLRPILDRISKDASEITYNCRNPESRLCAWVTPHQKMAM